MAGYWQGSFYCVFIDQDEVKVHTKLAKKELDQYPAIFIEQTWSKKDLLYVFRRNFSFETRWHSIMGKIAPSFPLG